ncbi:MAG TPA: multifunctional CCA tRNA nucleotidyl transferase/2'3'-cyclic phosphodiesterase/2'nucleotidase/phosphatase [Burkholderiales bacterium]|nr:multifunctional CCA tRNA nucleotidyl transferase/2'3'-cyclic phosphodiesterase/2'nucleotidase/phosphatase [Burkholderiales bacterium]
MKAYVVGGAVRDELLGLPVADRDWVVVGATPEEMAARGFKPVGRDFPVFLHPQTREEYALARTERKSGRGYKGFTVYSAPEVTLEQDLARRDLTINAMARDEAGRLVDPFGGERDLRARVLRHVSAAFAEDPVRILRVARFAARYEFRIADETRALMRRMVEAGEAGFLVAERVWQELAKGLMEKDAARMFEALDDCGALGPLLPELAELFASPQARAGVFAALGRAAQDAAPLAVRFALLAWMLEDDAARRIEAFAERLRLPNEVRELALTTCRCRAGLAGAHRASAAALLETLKRADAFRRPERFAELLRVARLAEPGAQAAAGAERLGRALAAAASVDAAAIAQAAAAPAEIPAQLDAARAQAIARALG